MNEIWKLMDVPPQFVEYYESRYHIKLEKWSKENNVAEFKNWVNNDKNKLNFANYHMNMTANLGYKWFNGATSDDLKSLIQQ